VGIATLLLFLVECYANKCFAEKLKSTIAESGISVKVQHRYNYGRDRIVKMLLSYTEPHHVVGIIDYEHGVSRSYIDKHFDLEEVETRVLLGTARGKQNILAVIFDPNIEEALLCRIYGSICKNPLYLRKRVKSSEACTTLSEILSDKEVEQLVSSIAKLLLEKLDIASDLQRGGIAVHR